MLRATGFTFGLPVLVTRSKVAVLLWPPAEAQCSLAQKSLRRPLDPVFGRRFRKLGVLEAGLPTLAVLWSKVAFPEPQT